MPIWHDLAVRSWIRSAELHDHGDVQFCLLCIISTRSKYKTFWGQHTAEIARKDLVRLPGENLPDIMEETVDGCFMPEAENLKLLIKQMLNYNISQRLKQKRCINTLHIFALLTIFPCERRIIIVHFGIWHIRDARECR
jgi:hypothetical protein